MPCSPLRTTASQGAALRRVRLLVDNALLLALGLLVLFFASQNDRFVSFDNFRLVLLQVSIMGIVSVPLALLLISGGIDLSVGSILGLGGMTSASLLDSGTPVTVAVLAGSSLVLRSVSPMAGCRSSRSSRRSWSLSVRWPRCAA